MSRQLTFSVVADGGTDRMLVPIIQWAIHRLDPQVAILEPEFSKRAGSVKNFLKTYTSDAMLIFVHRDAEGKDIKVRLKEFESTNGSRVVPVIPVQMSEAWLLIDGIAIARAAGSSSGKVATPRIAELERISDPKAHLENLILEAAGHPTGRRLKRLKRDMISRRMIVASYISDYSPLENLPAFARFQKFLRQRYPYPQ